MQIIILLLKLLLYGLLGLCGILIVLLGIVLLAPIRYKIYFEKYEQMAYDCHFRFLIGIKGKFQLEDGKRTDLVKVFWKTIYEAQLEPEQAKQGEQQQSKESSVQKAIYHSEKESQMIKKKHTKVQDQVKVDTDELTESAKKKAKRRMNWSVLKERSTYSFIKETVILLKHILLTIAPHSWDFELVVGKGDPADTGELLAKLIMFYPLYYRHGIIRGDYERDCIEGGFIAEGKFRLGTIGCYLISYLFKSSVRKMIMILIRS